MLMQSLWKGGSAVRYKIGDVARILGISPDLIRYYEEKGIVRPTKDPANNYRYYDAWDINYLTDCLWFKNFGFGIDQVSQLVTEYSYDSLLDCLDNKADELLASIKRQELLLQRIRKYCEKLVQTKKQLGKCDLAQNDEFVRYINRRNATYDSDARLQSLTREWLKYMPFTRRYFEIPEEALLAGGEDYEWGFSLGMQYVTEFGINIIPPIEFVPSALCIYSAFKSVGKGNFTPRHLDFMKDFAAENGYRITGRAFGNLSCSVIEDDLPTGYFEVWLPVEAEKK